MNANDYLKLWGAIVLTIVASLISHSDIFNESASEFRGGWKIDPNSTIRTLDFNGDSFPDVLIENYTMSDNPLRNFIISVNKKTPNYIPGIRESVVVNADAVLDIHSLKIAVAPPLSNPEENKKNSVILTDDSCRLKLIRYIDDEELLHLNRYYISPYRLTLGGADSKPLYSKVLYACLGDVLGQYGAIKDDLFVAADDGESCKLFLFDRPFYTIQKDEQDISPANSYALPGAPTFFESVELNEDGNGKSDLFFACDGVFYLWLSDFFIRGYTDQAFQSPIPSGVVGVSNVVQNENNSSFLVGVQTDADSDIAYVVFTQDDLSQSIPVSIPGKHLQGNTSRLFQYENQKTGESYPICIVYTPLDRENPQPNTFTIYKIDPNDPTTPQFVQEFRPEYVSSSGEPYYFDRPEVVCDIDNDGVSDIGMMAIGFESFTHALFLGYMGIASETGAENWRLY